ncbi:MAG TPA: hypothetical protein VKM94_14575 [Blastocatellia bacterium]|nr:hypothetical protein [Blastocatellia bacterium]
MKSQNRMLLKAWGALAIVFALGCVSGFALSGVLSSRAAVKQATSLRDPDAYFEALRSELILSPEQSSRVRSILEETRAEYRNICAETRPRYDMLRQQARSRMRDLLNEGQQQKFDSIVLQEDCSTCPDKR